MTQRSGPPRANGSSFGGPGVLSLFQEDARRELRGRTALHDLRAAQRRWPVLEPYARPEGVVSLLTSRDDETKALRSAVTVASAADYQRTMSRTWALVLLLGFEAALGSIRRSLRPVGCIDEGDLDGLVVETFLETAAAFPVASANGSAAADLALNTRKRVLKLLSGEAQHVRGRSSLGRLPPRIEATCEPSQPPFEAPCRCGEAAQRDLRVELLQALLAAEPARDVRVLTATYAAGVPLIEYVREQNPGADSTRLRREYDRLRRRRSRTRRRVRRLALRQKLDQPDAEYGGIQ